MVVWLQTPFTQIQERMPPTSMTGDRRPQGGIPAGNLRGPRDLYAKYADLIVASRDGEDDTAHLVEEVMRTVGLQA